MKLSSISVTDQIDGSLGSSDTYVTVDRAAALCGCTPERIANLVRRNLVSYRGSTRDPLLSLVEVARLGTLDASSILKAPPKRLAGEVQSITTFKWNRIVRGHALDEIAKMPSDSVQAVVTSPPFWGQRVYADEKSIHWGESDDAPYGREPQPNSYVAHSLEILAALSRVVRKDGTVWWNIGDSYMTRSIARASSSDRIHHYAGETTSWAKSPYKRYSTGHEYLKDKDLTLVPFLVAIGAQKLGYWVRSIIVWSKIHKGPDGQDASDDDRAVRAHVPEVVGDRPVVGHEYVLLLARSPSYRYYPKASGIFATANGDRTSLNARTVWSFPPADKSGNHVARFPRELPRRCILLGTKKNDLVFDPFAGEGTTLIEARRLGRRYFGCDISPTYVKAARESLVKIERDQESKARNRPGL